MRVQNVRKATSGWQALRSRFVSTLAATSLIAVCFMAATVSQSPSASASAVPIFTGTPAPSPANAAANPQEVLGQTVCPAQGTCVAVGDYLNLNQDLQAVIVTQTSGLWSAITPSRPGNANPTPDDGLDAVYCSSVSSCVAVGFYTDSGGNLQPLVDTLSSGVWTPTEVTLPINSNSNATASLGSISCTSATSCVAVGTYLDTNENSQALIETLSSATWTPREPSLPTQGDTAQLSSVSCPASGTCIAVGIYGNVAAQNTLPLIETLSSGTWSSSIPPFPSDAITNPPSAEFFELNGVSCASVGVCVAVGSYLNQSDNAVSFVETLTGGSWSVSQPPMPSSAYLNSIVAPTVGGLVAVSCPAGGSCIATGFYFDANDNLQSFTEVRLASGTWSPSLAALPPDANSNTQSSLDDITCTNIGACASSGAYEDANGSYLGFFETSDASGPVNVFTDPSIFSPEGITSGPDGALWIANTRGGVSGAGSIVRMTTAGVVTNNYTGANVANPVDITVGPDHALWFTSAGNSIGRITTAGVASDFTSVTIDEPEGITTGPDGALWFTNAGNNSIGRITTAGAVTNFTDPTIQEPMDIVTGPDNALWFTNWGDSSIGHITTAGAVTTYSDTGRISPFGITAGPDGALWFTNKSLSTIGRITTSGTFSTFSGNGISGPTGIAAGPDNALWFTNGGNNTIGRITTLGVVSNVFDNTIENPDGIVAGPDGALWFTNNAVGAVGSSIGRITVPVSITTATIPGISAVGSVYPSTTLAASGGTAPYSWSISSGALPAGLSLSSDGVISGTTASAETSNFTVEASDDTYPGWKATQSYSIVVSPGVAGPYSPLPPQRICDTRPSNPSGLSEQAAQCNGPVNLGSPLSAGGTMNITVASFFGVPANATAVVLNVTVVGPSASGYLTAFPTGSPAPLSSNINYVAGAVVPNLVEVGTGTSGDVSFYSSQATNLVVDVEGFVSPTSLDGAGLYVPLASPTRICDTRAGNPSNLSNPDNQCNGMNNVGTTLRAAGVITVDVAGGTLPIPAGATAAVFNVTAVNPTQSGYLTVYPEDSTRPVVSNVNFTAGRVVPNRVIVPLSSSTGPNNPGEISIYSSSPVDIIVDVSGYYTAGGAVSGTQFTSEGAPVRICDTRAGNPSNLVSPNTQCGGQTITTGGILTVHVAGYAGVPATGAQAVVVNLTAVGPTAPTYLTVFPGPTQPTVSDLNLVAGQIKANLVVATVNSNGTISIYNHIGSTNVVVDVLGWYSTVPI